MPKEKLLIGASSAPNVLFIGNGLLQLGGGGNWSSLLNKINPKPDYTIDLVGVPYAMQPEALCGVDVEEVQRKTSASIEDGNAHILLRKVLQLPFDAIITTNYTYEIETVLSDNVWNEKERRKAFFALDGKSHVRHNTSVCNLIQCRNGRKIPVFHAHGERLRKHSLILSYYSYANSVSRLVSLNKQRGNTYQEHQEANESIECLSWLDYFLLGNVYSIGFGFDTSEFDIWWAIERKAREKARHGKLHAYMIVNDERPSPIDKLFQAMDVMCHHVIKIADYSAAYQEVYEKICDMMQESGIHHE